MPFHHNVKNVASRKQYITSSPKSALLPIERLHLIYFSYTSTRFLSSGESIIVCVCVILKPGYKIIKLYYYKMMFLVFLLNSCLLIFFFLLMCEILNIFVVLELFISLLLSVIYSYAKLFIESINLW